VSTFDDPNREAVGLPPIWTGADVDPTDPVDPGEVVPEAFDPGEHTVAEVEAYLDEHPDERDRVLAAEADGKARVSLLGAE